MNEQTTSTQTWFADKWERLVAVDVPDEEEARVGRVFNILMVISTGIVTAIALTFILMWALGLTPAFTAWLGAAFPLTFIPLSLFCIVQARRGHIRPMIGLYVWVNFFGIALAAFIFDGPRSPAWILYIWTIIVAGTLMAPGYALRMMGGAVLYFLFFLLLTWLGFYTPPLTLGPRGREFEYIAFTMIMLIFAVGLLTNLNMRSLLGTLARLRTTTLDLEEHRRTLERRVAERTRDLERRAVQLEAAAKVSREAAAIRDVNELLAKTVRLVSEDFGFYHAGIFLLDESGEYAVLRAASSEGGQYMLERGHRLKVGEVGIVGRVSRTGEPRIALDVGADAVFFNNPDLPNTRSEIGLPLRVRQRAIGVLDVQSTEEAAFSVEDVAVLQTLADQVALAIDNARLLEESDRTLRELEAFYGQRAREAWQGRADAYRYTGVGVEPVHDPSSISSFVHEDDERQLTASISLRGQTLGSIALRPAPEREPWSPEEIALVEQVTTQVGLALENARLLEETRRRAEREQTLSDMTARFSRSINVDGLLRTAVRELGRLLRIEDVSVHVGPPEDAPSLPGEFKEGI